jgi:hypothetical protein
MLLTEQSKEVTINSRQYCQSCVATLEAFQR